MNQPPSLPFKAGDRVEIKSFLHGYRGAWFRAEIKETRKKGVMFVLSDYTEEKPRTMKSIYHKVPSKSKGTKKELMLRPQFPRVCNEDEAPDMNTLSEVIVLTSGAWKVGDLVDWFCEGAYWSGTITKFHTDDKVELQFPPKPMGEGLVYEALCKDLRPSLEWSQKSGWKVAVPKQHNSSNNGNAIWLSQRNTSYCPCARLIVPQEERRAQNVPNMLNKEQAPENEEAREKIELNINIPLNSSKCDSIESSILDIEELLNRVKWMKRILEPAESVNGGWKLQEYRAVGDKLGP